MSLMTYSVREPLCAQCVLRWVASVTYRAVDMSCVSLEGLHAKHAKTIQRVVISEMLGPIT